MQKLRSYLNKYTSYNKWHLSVSLIFIVITIIIVLFVFNIKFDKKYAKNSEILTPIGEKPNPSQKPNLIQRKKQIAITFTSPQNEETIQDKDAVLIDIKAESLNRISKIKIFVDNTLVKTCFVTNFCSHWWNTKNIPKGNHIIQAETQDSSSPQYTETKSIVVVK